jgi:hypothetical protein
MAMPVKKKKTEEGWASWEGGGIKDKKVKGKAEEKEINFGRPNL